MDPSNKISAIITILSVAGLQLSITAYCLHTLTMTATLLAPLYGFSFLLWCKLDSSANERIVRILAFFGIIILHLYHCGKYANHSSPDLAQLLLLVQGVLFSTGAKL